MHIKEENLKSKSKKANLKKQKNICIYTRVYAFK